MRLTALFATALLLLAGEARADCSWRAAWASSQMRPNPGDGLPPSALRDSTLRQIVRPSIGGGQVRIRISNAFGDTPLRIGGATLARATDPASARIDAASLRPLRFGSAPGTVIPPGGEWLSDPLTFPVIAFDDLAVSLHLDEAPQSQTSHPGSRATSYFISGDASAAADLPTASKTDHWYLLSGLEVTSCTQDGIVALGDSITDGRGSTTNGNDRWTDMLARRLGGRVAVINQGIGGNRLLLDGLGPNALARLDRDVLAQPGISDVIVLEGINDIGTLAREAPASPGAHRALVTQMTGAYAQIVARARARGLKIYGGTLLPFLSNAYYHPDAASEADRQAINAWIRTPGNFDSVVDFDRALRDPERPAYLDPRYDSGDGLHPNPAGYRAMAAAVPLAAFARSTTAEVDDGYDLWMRYPPSATAPEVEIRGETAIITAARNELRRGLPQSAGPVVLARASDPDIAALRLATARLGDEGYLVRRATIGGRAVTLIAANGDRGLLYGAFALLRHIGTGGAIETIDLQSAPALPLRILDHWDNLDGSVERGYAGQSLWDWWNLPDVRDPRYIDYARANASIGINGAVLNNVNAKAESLTAPYIAKAAALADTFRPYGIRVYLSARFSAPIELGGLKTADPRDPAVAAWWAAKADEIYRAIPDFGGFLVKANSEGQPGPRDYGASHADGANMLAAAVKPHGGIVMWRAFVYADTDPEDRAKQAYSEFTPLDGKFADNVFVQVKNGPIDFQPREPVHPLFGAMPRTRLMLEFQITKEYLGFASHLVYLAPLFREVLEAQTGARQGETVARAIGGIAGVANIGRDRNWTGSIFNQANWYAFGRLAWDPALSSEAIAQEWIAQTFGSDPGLMRAVTGIMIDSREAVVDYTGPLGLAHLMATGHHYGPGPWVSDLKRPEWNPVYYHRADAAGIGFDRTATGSDAIAQYAPPLARRYADPATTPLTELLWFHHLPWQYRLPTGRSLWEELVSRYDRGVSTVADMRRRWDTLEPRIDAERWQQTAALLAIQEREARWWRDASLAYWMSLNGLPLPPGSAAPAHDLDWYKAQSFPFAPGNPH